MPATPAPLAESSAPALGRLRRPSAVLGRIRPPFGLLLPRVETPRMNRNRICREQRLTIPKGGPNSKGQYRLRHHTRRDPPPRRACFLEHLLEIQKSAETLTIDRWKIRGTKIVRRNLLRERFPL